MAVNLSELEASFQALVDDENDSRGTMLAGYLREDPARIAQFATAEDLAPVLSVAVSADVHASIRKRFADLRDEDPDAQDAVGELLERFAPDFSVSQKVAGLASWFDGLRAHDEGLARRVGVGLAYLRTRRSFQPRIHPHTGN